MGGAWEIADCRSIVNAIATESEATGLISSIFLLDAPHSFLLLEGQSLRQFPHRWFENRATLRTPVNRAALAERQVTTHTLRRGLCARGKPGGLSLPHTLSGSQLVAWNCTLRSCTYCRRSPLFPNVPSMVVTLILSLSLWNRDFQNLRSSASILSSSLTYSRKGPLYPS